MDPSVSAEVFLSDAIETRGNLAAKLEEIKASTWPASDPAVVNDESARDHAGTRHWIAHFGLQHYMPVSQQSSLSLLAAVYIAYLHTLSYQPAAQTIQRVVYIENQAGLFGARDFFGIVRNIMLSARRASEMTKFFVPKSSSAWRSCLNYHRFVLTYLNAAATCLLFHNTDEQQWRFARQPDEEEVGSFETRPPSPEKWSNLPSVGSNAKFALSRQAQAEVRRQAIRRRQARQEELEAEAERLRQTDTVQRGPEREKQIEDDTVRAEFQKSDTALAVAVTEVSACMMAWTEAHLSWLQPLSWQPFHIHATASDLERSTRCLRTFLQQRLSFGAPDELYNFTVNAIYHATLAGTSKQTFFRHHGVVQEEVSIVTVFNDSFHPEEARQIQKSFNDRTVETLFEDTAHPFRAAIIVAVFAFYFNVHTRNQCVWEKEYFSSQYDRPQWLQKQTVFPHLCQWHGIWLLSTATHVYTAPDTFSALAQWCWLFRQDFAATTHVNGHACANLLDEIIGPNLNEPVEH
jgi:hypothetical protein